MSSSENLNLNGTTSDYTSFKQWLENEKIARQLWQSSTTSFEEKFGRRKTLGVGRTSSEKPDETDEKYTLAAFMN